MRLTARRQLLRQSSHVTRQRLRLRLGLLHPSCRLRNLSGGVTLHLRVAKLDQCVELVHLYAEVGLLE